MRRCGLLINTILIPMLNRKLLVVNSPFLPVNPQTVKIEGEGRFSVGPPPPKTKEVVKSIK